MDGTLPRAGAPSMCSALGQKTRSCSLEFQSAFKVRPKEESRSGQTVGMKRQVELKMKCSRNSGSREYNE